MYSHLTSAQEKLTFAVIGKTLNDSFYEQSFDGCLHFAATIKNLDCIYDGPLNYQDIRSQGFAVERVLAKGIDGLIISVTDSAYLADYILPKLAKLNIPVITFDSDLLSAHHHHRLTYVGTNNVEFGKALGEYATKFKRPGVNHVCIYSGHPTTPNLNDRIKGVRLFLSNNQTASRLHGENDWFEIERCPYYSLGKRDQALSQLINSFDNKVPINIAVAGFAQFSPKYIEAIKPYKKLLETEEVVFVSADTEPLQLSALRERLSTINIGQNPFEMGRLSADLLFNYLTQNTLPEKDMYFLDFHYCHTENFDTCTQK